MAQDGELMSQIDRLKYQRTEAIQKIAQLKQEIVEIETQENEAIREVSHFTELYYSIITRCLPMPICLCGSMAGDFVCLLLLCILATSKIIRVVS